MMDICDFYDCDETREYLRKPFILDVNTVATNGKALVFMPKVGKYQPLENILLIHKILEFREKIKLAVLKPMPNVTMPDLIKCAVCQGSGNSIRSTCPECGGNGVVDAETDFSTYYELECRTCDGDGYEITSGLGKGCLDCHNSGYVLPRHFPIKIDGTHVYAELLKKIINAPNIMIKGDGEFLIFKSGENSGILMGMHT